MGRIRAKDTKPEWVVRRLAHAMGYRFRLHRRDLPGTPDMVFSGRRVVIFVNGCFWHGHDCREGSRVPGSNADYWIAKITGNRIRDAKNQGWLREAGWKVAVIWECQTRDLDSLRVVLGGILGT